MNDNFYRPASILAIICLILSCVSVMGFLSVAWILVGLVSFVTGILAITRIRKYELTGLLMAVAGMFVSTVALIGAPLWHHTQYESESLPGYERVVFAELIGNKDKWQNLVGKNICIKGYEICNLEMIENNAMLVSYNGGYDDLKNTIIVSQPTIENHTFKTPLVIYGRLTENPNWKKEMKAPRYILQCDLIRESKTHYDLATLQKHDSC